MNDDLLYAYQRKAVALLAAEDPRSGDVWVCMEGSRPPTRGTARRRYEEGLANGAVQPDAPCTPARRCRVLGIDGEICTMINIETKRRSRVSRTTLRTMWKLVEREGESV